MVPILDLSRGRRQAALAAVSFVAVVVSGCEQSASSTSVPAPRGPGPSSTTTTTAPVPARPTRTSTVRVPDGAQSARVRAVVDGDTLHLIASGEGPLSAGQDERARLLEIDAPEIHGTVECYGAEATADLARLTPVGSTVRVAADRERHDRYGRPLLYVWNADGIFVNEALVRAGDVSALLVRPNDAHIDVMRAAERDARAARRGQWGAC